jgi:hypothetical protein
MFDEKFDHGVSIAVRLGQAVVKWRLAGMFLGSIWVHSAFE